MDLKLSPAEQTLRDQLRDWLDTEYSFDAHLRRTTNPATRDEGFWAAMVERGWITRALPRRDALQQSTIDAAIVAEEFGRALVVEPFFRSGYLAANILFEAVPNRNGQELINQIGNGAHRFCCALFEPEGRFRVEAIAAQATEAGDIWRISGRKAVVLDGADADRILVSARTPDGSAGLFLVDGEASGMTRTAFRTIDDAAVADIAFDNVRAHQLAIGNDVISSLSSGIDRTITALGAEVVGAAGAALNETAAFAGKREQFGKPIAQFQVIAHRLARMFIELEGLRGGLIEALALCTATADERALAASGLKVLIGDNGRYVVNQGIQVHGGVGTLNDYKVSHCFKRVFALETLYGNGDFYLERYASAMT